MGIISSLDLYSNCCFNVNKLVKRFIFILNNTIMKVIGNLNHFYHLAYLRYIVWQRKRDCIVEMQKISSGSNYKPLSESQKQDIKNYWNSFSKKNYFDMKWYEVFNAFSNNDQLKYYLPHDFYYCYVDTMFANAQKAYVLDDKNMYDFYFHDVKMPETVCRRMGGVFLDGKYNVISYDDALKKCCNYGEVIIKKTINSCGGSGISFWNTNDNNLDDLKVFFNDNDNFIVQSIVRQHRELAKLHGRSVNTIRIMTLIYGEEVLPISSIIRMGANNSRIDNASTGGLVCGIKKTGQLREIAYDGMHNIFRMHPQGAHFSDIIIPNFEKCIETACCLAGRFASVTKLVSWDFSIDEASNPVLIEANLTYGGIGVHQKCNGPLFGSRTEDILHYVFNHHPFLK